LLALFHDGGRLASAGLTAVRGYLDPDDADRDALDRRRAQLAAKIAELFDEYAYSRPEMLTAWKKGSLIAGWDEPTQRWQRELWTALFGPGGALTGRRAVSLPDFFERTAPEALRLPGAIHVFGISFVARLYRRSSRRWRERRRCSSTRLTRAASCGRTCSRRADRARSAARRSGSSRWHSATRRAGPRPLPPPSRRIRFSRRGASRAGTASACTTSCPTAISTSASRIRRPGLRRRRCSRRCSAKFSSARRAARTRRRPTTAW
jgi:hypothetical protein